MSLQFSPDTTMPMQVKSAALPAQRRAGRFAETGGVRVLRGVFRALCRVAPAVAAQLAYRQLARPPRAEVREWQQAVRRQATLRKLRFGPGELAVYEWGQGPAILMVHGWGSHATHMGKMIAPLVNAGFRVVAFDAPAHGASSGGSTDLVQFAAAIAAVAADAGPLHCVLAHSFGASMAMYAWRDWGVEAEKMVLISSFDHCNWFIEAFGQHVGLTPEVLSRVRLMLVRLYGGRLDWSRMSVVDMARATDFPVLVIHDENDEEIPVEHSLAIAGALPRPQLKVTSGLGHHLVVRNVGVAGEIVRFVTE